MIRRLFLLVMVAAAVVLAFPALRNLLPGERARALKRDTARVAELQSAIELARHLQDGQRQALEMGRQEVEKQKIWAKELAAHDAELLRNIAKDQEGQDRGLLNPAEADRLIRERIKLDMQEGTPAERLRKQSEEAWGR